MIEHFIVVPCLHNACVLVVVHKKITLPAVGCILNLILLGDCDVSNPYSGICLWNLVVDPFLIPSDDTCEKVVLFILIPVEKVLADIQAFGHVVIYELLGNPLCTDFMKT
jgi:hypothetical protein